MTRDRALDKSSSALAKILGQDRLYNEVDREKFACGIPIPPLIYRIYLQTTHLPFAMHGSSAPTAVGKTWDCIQKLIWNVKAGGLSVFTDTEHKSSVDMAKSMIRRELKPEEWKYFKTVPAFSVEEWQKTVITYLKQAIEDRGLPKGERYSIAVGVDSLLGKGLQSSIDELMKEGFAKGRGYKEETMSIKNFCEAFDRQGAFFSLFTVQHAKKSLDPNAKGIDAWNVIGGTAPRFHSQTHNFMLRAGQHSSQGDAGEAIEGHDIRMVCVKNGLGGDRKAIYGGIRWHILEDEGGNAYQESWFDWNWSLGWFLAQQIMNGKVLTTLKSSLQDLISFKVKNQNNVECEKYSQKTMTYSEFGKCIEEDKELVEELENLFGVKTIKDYREIEAQHAPADKKERKAKAKKVEQDTEPDTPEFDLEDE